MMIAMLLLGLIQPADEPVIVREQRTLALPREIAHAVAPYAMCMLEDQNDRMPGSETGDAARAAIKLVKADCGSVRDQAESQARESLRASNMSETGRVSMIAETLNSIDQILDHVAERLDAAAGQRPRDE